MAKKVRIWRFSQEALLGGEEDEAGQKGMNLKAWTSMACGSRRSRFLHMYPKALVKPHKVILDDFSMSLEIFGI